jgi:Protein of unknown function (DUF664)
MEHGVRPLIHRRTSAASARCAQCLLSFACWQGVFENEWMLIPGAAVAEVTGALPPMPGPDEPGPFSLADPDRVRAVLAAAGFGSLAIEPHADYVAIGAAYARHDGHADLLRERIDGRVGE